MAKEISEGKQYTFFLLSLFTVDVASYFLRHLECKVFPLIACILFAGVERSLRMRFGWVITCALGVFLLLVQATYNFLLL